MFRRVAEEKLFITTEPCAQAAAERKNKRMAFLGKGGTRADASGTTCACHVSKRHETNNNRSGLGL